MTPNDRAPSSSFTAEDEAILSILDLMLLHGATPSDFMLSFPSVRALQDLQTALTLVQEERNAALQTCAELAEERDFFAEALVAARDILAAFGIDAGRLQGGGYAATMTDAERKLAQGVDVIDRLQSTPREPSRAQQEIARLTADLAQGQQARERLIADSTHRALAAGEEIARLTAERAALQAENERLKAALTGDHDCELVRARDELTALRAALAALRPLVEQWRAEAKMSARYGVGQSVGARASNREYYGSVNAAFAYQACADALATHLSTLEGE